MENGLQCFTTVAGFAITHEEDGISDKQEQRLIRQLKDLKNNKDEKSASAKTITLRSNGTAQLIEELEARQEEQALNLQKTVADPDEAAVKIQAAFRGHKSRKDMKQPSEQPKAPPAEQNAEEELSLDDPELANAATKIQASFRGHKTRKEMEKKGETSPVGKKDTGEELDIDLTDPDLNKAAVKIQASFKGHMVRKENQKHTSDH